MKKLLPFLVVFASGCATADMFHRYDSDGASRSRLQINKHDGMSVISTWLVAWFSTSDGVLDHATDYQLQRATLPAERVRGARASIGDLAVMI